MPKPNFEVWISNYGWSFDIELLKNLEFIGLIIMYMEIQFVQKIDLRNKSHDQLLVKNKSGATTKGMIFYFL